MKRFYVTRCGWNGANQSSLNGAPYEMRVAEVQAKNSEEAKEKARAAGVSCYNNQHLSAYDADQEDAEEAKLQSEVAIM